MDFQDEKLSIISILLITGISCLLFTGLMKLLEGNIIPLFYYVGLVTFSAGSVLFLLKQVSEIQQSRKKTEKTPE